MFPHPKVVLGVRISLGIVFSVALALGQVVSFEGNSYPEDDGWERSLDCDPIRTIENGWFVQEVELDCGGPGHGERDRYVRSLESFAGAPTFFFEWRVVSTGDRSEIICVAPCSFVTADLYGVGYHFTIARDQVRLIRDNFLPLVFVDLEPTAPHTYRLELRGGESYSWWIDGKVVDAGVPEGAYPTPTGVLAWRASACYEDSVTRWDYIRYAVIPDDASGDYDSDIAITLDDHYFVVDCLTKDGPGIFGGPDEDAGPGCRFADFDADSDVDLLDLANFQNLFGS